MQVSRSFGRKIKVSEYKTKGAIPVYDQGSDYISGYTDDLNAIYKGLLPAVLFGDHTIRLRLINHQFAIGADGIQILEPIDNKSLDKAFFYYLLKRAIKNLKSYGYERHLKYLRDLEIFYPKDLNEQKRIADILSAFDDKIELNNKIIKTLEEMAQAIFKEWFVKFRFPGWKKTKFVDSELGKIPKGWKVSALGKIMVLRKEKFKKFEEWKNLKLLDLGRFPQKSLAIKDYGKGEEIKTSALKFYKGDILFGAVRPYFHKVVIAPFDGVTNQSVFVIFPQKLEFYSFLITILFSGATINYATTRASGTKMPVIKYEDLANMPIILPCFRIFERFNNIVDKFYEIIIKKVKENQKLAALRDLLLPKLMSGEIRVNS